MIQAIIFDCFGVLTTDLWKEFVATLPENQRAEASDLNKQVDAGSITTESFFEQVRQLTGRSAPEIKNTITQSSDKNYKLLDYIRSLQDTYKLAILSNVSSDFITNQFLTTDERALFDVIVASYSVGLVKPDSQIFEYVAEKLAVKLSECIMIDDSVANCEGARVAGMQAVHYKDFATFESDLNHLISA